MFPMITAKRKIHLIKRTCILIIRRYFSISILKASRNTCFHYFDFTKLKMRNDQKWSRKRKKAHDLPEPETPMITIPNPVFA
jgi:hypothetical protein